MSAYDIYVFFHVASAIVWVGAATLTQINGRRVMATNDSAEVQSFIKQVVWLAPRLFIPFSLLTVVFGFVVVGKGPWSFSDPFVQAGLTMFVISFLIGIAYLTPQTEKLDKLADAGEADTPAYNAIVSRVLAASAFELVLLWATVFVMVTKPG